MRMHRHAPTVTLAVLALALTGCATQQPIAAAPEPTPTVDACLPVTDGALGALQLLAKDNVTFTRAAAVHDGDAWFVAAEFDVDYGDEVNTLTATWVTQQDPTTAEDAAYLAADSVAVEVADYAPRPNVTSTDPAVTAAQDCLTP